MKSLFHMTQGERRAAVAGVNLFFAALLGANLGNLNELSLKEHIFLSVLIAGAVSGLFVAAVSFRRTLSFSILIAYALLLGTLVLLPRPGLIDLIDSETQLQSIVATLVVWTTFLILMRITPLLPGEGAEAMTIEDEIGAADRRRS